MSSLVVLQNSELVSRFLFLPAKTGGRSQLKFGYVQAILVPVESADLTTILAVHKCPDRVKRDAVALVADLADGHQGSSNRRNLKYRLDIAANGIITQVQLALT